MTVVKSLSRITNLQKIRFDAVYALNGVGTRDAQGIRANANNTIIVTMKTHQGEMMMTSSCVHQAPYVDKSDED